MGRKMFFIYRWKMFGGMSIEKVLVEKCCLFFSIIIIFIFIMVNIFNVLGLMLIVLKILFILFFNVVL